MRAVYEFEKGVYSPHAGRKKMLKVVLKRFAQLIPTLLIVILFTFVATRIIPGNPLYAIIGDEYEPEIVDQLMEEFGFNKPIFEQLLDYINDILHGDFGQSFYFHVPAVDMIMMRLPNTLLLSGTSLLLSVIVGMLLGICCACRQSTVLDYVLSVISILGVCAPVFWVAIMLVMVFSVHLGWLPVFGMGSLAEDGLFECLRHFILPCVCLCIGPVGSFTRLTRTSMIETLGNDSIRALRARGITGRKIIFKHALKNALPPILTVIGIQFAGCFSGAVLTENIFTWPGMGTLISSAIDNRDYSLIQAIVLVIAIAFVLINLLTDILYMLINPKIAFDASKGGKG